MHYMAEDVDGSMESAAFMIKGYSYWGGLRLKFDLQPPVGNERRNSGTILPLENLKNFQDVE